MKCGWDQTAYIRIVRVHDNDAFAMPISFCVYVGTYHDPIGSNEHAISFRSVLNVAIEAGVMVAKVQCSAGAIVRRVHVPKFKNRKSAFERVRVEMEVVARFMRLVFPRTRLDLCFKMIHFARGTDICIVSN